tara:strand:+ start:9869 stop:11143 length:1275 start_codon:yes stop_codon:yes gene_type:complete
MGFISTANTITVTTKLTKLGRERILTNNNTIFSHFILGDSDANYRTSEFLTTGKIPAASGDLGQNNILKGIIKSKIYVKGNMGTRKPVETNSTKVTTTVDIIGEMSVTGNSLNYVLLNKNNSSVDFTNLFSSLSLPITNSKIAVFGKTAQFGGWADTAFSNFSASTVLLASINTDQYGEVIDGKNIRLTLPVFTGFTSGGTGTGSTTYSIFSTFPNTTIPRSNLDEQYTDKSTLPTSLFGNNISVSYLVTDSIQRPNNDLLKSWATGYDSYKPFTLNNKSLINVNTISTNNVNADRVVGIAYLEEGFLVLTDREIVDNVVINFSGDTESGIVTDTLGFYNYSGTTYGATINSCDNNIVQNVVCMASRDEYYRTQNRTKGLNDDIRISEIAITTASGEILALGKFDRQVIKKKNDLLVLDVQIVV